MSSWAARLMAVISLLFFLAPQVLSRSPSLRSIYNDSVSSISKLSSTASAKARVFPLLRTADGYNKNSTNRAHGVLISTSIGGVSPSSGKVVSTSVDSTSRVTRLESTVNTVMSTRSLTVVPINNANFDYPAQAINAFTYYSDPSVIQGWTIEFDRSTDPYYDGPFGAVITNGIKQADPVLFQISQGNPWSDTPLPYGTTQALAVQLLPGITKSFTASQSLSLTSGLYTLQFYARPRPMPYYNAANKLTASLNDASVTTTFIPGDGWILFTLTATIETAGTYPLSFNFFDSSDTNTSISLTGIAIGPIRTYQSYAQIDYPYQGDLYYITGGTVASCATKCDTLAGCTGFIFRSSDSYCYYKNIGSTGVPSFFAADTY